MKTRACSGQEKRWKREWRRFLKRCRAGLFWGKSTARVFANAKLGCFVLFDSKQQAASDEKPEASHFPSSLFAANIDKEHEPSPRHRLLKAKFTVCSPSGSEQHMCVRVALAYHCLRQKLVWSARFSLGRAAWQTPRSKQDSQWQYANGALHYSPPTSSASPQISNISITSARRPAPPAAAWLISHQALHFSCERPISHVAQQRFTSDSISRGAQIKLFTFKCCRDGRPLKERRWRHLKPPYLSISGRMNQWEDRVRLDLLTREETCRIISTRRPLSDQRGSSVSGRFILLRKCQSWFLDSCVHSFCI